MVYQKFIREHNISKFTPCIFYPISSLLLICCSPTTKKEQKQISHSDRRKVYLNCYHKVICYWTMFFFSIFCRQTIHLCYTAKQATSWTLHNATVAWLVCCVRWSGTNAHQEQLEGISICSYCGCAVSEKNIFIFLRLVSDKKIMMTEHLATILLHNRLYKQFHQLLVVHI